MDSLYAARKCFIKNDNIKSVIAYIPSKVILESHFTVECNNLLRDFYQVDFPSINQKNIEFIDSDIVENIFSNKEECSNYCQNFNKVIWEPFLSTCDHEKYRSDIETINNEFKLEKEDSLER